MYVLIGSVISSIALLLASTGAAASNLVGNPDFDSNTSQWALAAGSGTFAADPSIGSPAAPSLHLAASSPPGITAWSDCIAVQATQPVDLYVDVLAQSGLASASVSAYSDAGCTAHLDDLVTTALRGGDGAEWTTLSLLSSTLPSGTQGVRVGLSASNGGTFGGSGDAHFDHVRFGAAGTAPVALQTFDVE